jgi:hypothetical protein
MAFSVCVIALFVFKCTCIHLPVSPPGILRRSLTMCLSWQVEVGMWTAADKFSQGIKLGFPQGGFHCLRHHTYHRSWLWTRKRNGRQSVAWCYQGCTHTAHTSVTFTFITSMSVLALRVCWSTQKSHDVTRDAHTAHTSVTITTSMSVLALRVFRELQNSHDVTRAAHTAHTIVTFIISMSVLALRLCKGQQQLVHFKKL